MKLNMKEKMELIKKISEAILKENFDIEIPIKGYHEISKLDYEHECDICKEKWNEEGTCVSRTILHITIEEEDHFHVCKECKNKLKKQGKEEFRR